MKPRILLVAAAATASALLLAGCSSGTAPAASSSSSTLRMALTSDLPTLDPGTVYQYEGNQVITAVYEGLLQYAPDSTAKIEPLLASAHTESSDGLTYTFTLRPDATFSDGTPVTAAAVQQSFERLAAKGVASQMSYMVAGVKSYETPSDDTFVVHLKAPQSDFLTLVASPFGPKVINPAVLKAHAGDDAKAYLATHVAGTGPYTLSAYTKGQQYVLQRNAKYWGAKPHFATVSLKIIPSAATQLVNLRGGSLDVISGQPIATVQSFKGNPKFSIASFPLLQKAQLHLKVTGALADVAVRTALRQAVDRPALVRQTWGEYATESTQMYPLSNVPSGSATDDWTPDASAAKGVLQGKTFTLGYSATQSQDKQVAETLQTQLEAAGATITLVPVESPDAVYSWSSDPSTAPDLFYEASYPDSTHPDTWARLFWYHDLKTGGVLNYLVGGTAEADAAIDAGLADTAESGSTADYAKAGDLIHDQVGYITLADLQDTYLLRSGLTAKGHWLTAPKALDLATVTER